LTAELLDYLLGPRSSTAFDQNQVSRLGNFA
jgi:hypothetical protein